MQISTAATYRGSQTGFTLIELSLVVFILGLVAAIAIPRLGNIGRARLETQTKRLAAVVRYLHGEAAFRGLVYRLNYDLDAQTYWVTMLVAGRDGPEFTADPRPLSRPVQRPRTITFAGVSTADTGLIHTGQVVTHFYPHGYTDPTLIHLRHRSSQVMTVTISPLTGDARVSAGYGEARFP